MTACASSRSIRARRAPSPLPGATPGTAWTVMQRVDHPDPAAANAQALEDLENGATGLTLVFAGSLNANGYGLAASPETLARVLDGVHARRRHHHRLQPQPGDAHGGAAFRGAGEKPENFAGGSRYARRASIRSAVSPRPAPAPLPWSELSKTLAANIRDLAEQGYRGPFAVADGRIIHNAGGSEAQELAFALAAAVDCLRALEAGGVPLEAARGMIYFRLAADADEFLTIAKFRAFGNCGRASKRPAG